MCDKAFVLVAAINKDPVHGDAVRINLADYRKKNWGVSEQSNEHSGYINGRKFLDLLSDY
jgi:hypothetical protein